MTLNAARRNGESAVVVSKCLCSTALSAVCSQPHSTQCIFTDLYTYGEVLQSSYTT